MLSELLYNFISGYQGKMDNTFYKDAFTSKLTDKIPSVIKGTLPNGYQYVVKGSVGTGRWAETPWVAVLDPSITDSVQTGYYVCYLINPKQKTMYLSLAVGWTQFANKYTSHDAQKAISDYSKYLLGQLASVQNEFVSGPIDLSAQHPLSKGYEQGQILSKKYSLVDLNDDILFSDLKKMLHLYSELRDIVGVSILNISYDKIITNTKISETEKLENQKTLKFKPEFHTIKSLENPLINRIPLNNEDIDVNGVDMTVRVYEENELDKIREKLQNISRIEPPERIRREAYRAVRDPQIAMLIKKSQNFICEICNREPFIQQNGKPYAEADHIQPLGGNYNGIDTPENMRCLCAQCHAVITHGSDVVIEELLQSTKWHKTSIT